MQTSTFKFILNLQKTQSQIAIPVTRGDNARTWCISFLDGKEPYEIAEGCLAKLEIKRPTGTHIEEFCPIENKSTVRYSFTQNPNTAAVEGLHDCQIILFDEQGNVIGSPRFSMIVSDRIIDSDDLNLSDEDKLIIESIITAEASRQSAEIERINAESTRIASEEQRVQNETARQTAGIEYALAEENRGKRFEALQKDVTDAIGAIVSPAVTVVPTDTGYRITVTDKKGTQTFSVTNGKNGAQGPQGIQGVQGVQGLQGIPGEAGKPFSIEKTYDSIAAMNSGFSKDGVSEGGFVVITSGVDDEDNAKLFVKGKSAYTFITDLSGAQGLQGPQGAQGPQGVAGQNGENGKDYVLTESDKNAIADKVGRIVYAPKFVQSVNEMTDTEKCYALESTKTLWTYSNEGEKEVIASMVEAIQASPDNNYAAGYRISTSDGQPQTKEGYVTSPYIDLSRYYENNTAVTIVLSGLTWAYPSATGNDTNVRVGLYDESKGFVSTNTTVYPEKWTSVSFEFDGNTARITVPVPYKPSSKTVRYLRFCAKGSWSDDYIHVEYKGKTTIPGGWNWRDTGIEYPPKATEPEITTNIFTQTNPAVRTFMALEDYNNGDYSYTNVTSHVGSDYYRKDLPFPVLLSWDKMDNAVQYTVSINHLDDAVLNTGLQIYYTKDNSINILNLIPNTQYWYKVHGLTAGGTKELIKYDSFKTAADKTRLLNIDGIQNVRDIGGHTGMMGKRVKYGRIIRGSAVDEDYRTIIRISKDGGYELTRRIGIRTDVDLRGNRSESVLVANTDSEICFKSFAYENYASAITNADQMVMFKEIFEYIVERLEKDRPIYVHCQGGCDRTGTLIFLLLGLLGVSESDLAKEYELSSFSPIGNRTRTRNSTTFDYKGMVTAIRSYCETDEAIYSGIYEFANVACKISDTTITKFQSLMLE